MLVAVFILVYLEDEGKVVVESEKKKKNPISVKCNEVFSKKNWKLKGKNQTTLPKPKQKQ